MPETIADILRNPVKEKLARGEVVASMTVRLVSNIEIASLARTAGFDTLYIDVEHSSFSLATASQICITALAVGIAPFVRVPSIRPEHVGRVLDGGALGVIAPHIRSRREIPAARRALRRRWPAAPALPRVSAGGGEPGAQRRDDRHGPVRSAEFLDHADEIMAVEGVDMAMIGTNDLLADWGLTGQYEHPRVREAYARVIAAARKHGKHVGVGGLATRPQLAAELVKMGARYVSTGTDLAFLLAACTEKAKQVREMIA
jgi:4-hydroxy-2-oxoheptanedioate aldolase